MPINNNNPVINITPCNTLRPVLLSIDAITKNVITIIATVAIVIPVDAVSFISAIIKMVDTIQLLHHCAHTAFLSSKGRFWGGFSFADGIQFLIA